MLKELPKRTRDRLIKEHGDIVLPETGQIIIQREGPWMGLGYVIGIRAEMFQIQWAGRKNVVLPYHPDDVKIYLGTKKWALAEE